MDKELEGSCIGLDTVTTDLLELYTARFNKRIKRGLAGRECPYEPTPATMEILARALLRQILLEWFEREGRRK